MKTLKITPAKFAIAILVLTTGLFSCKKDTGVAASTTSSQLLFGLTADNALATASTSGLTINASTIATPANITWTSGIANVSQFKFEAKKAGVEKEVKASGLSNIDLFALAPLLTNAQIDTGTYSEIELRIEFAKSATAIPLDLKGSFTKADGSIVPVEVVLNEDLEIRAEAKNVVV